MGDKISYAKLQNEELISHLTTNILISLEKKKNISSIEVNENQFHIKEFDLEKQIFQLIEPKFKSVDAQFSSPFIDQRQLIFLCNLINSLVDFFLNFIYFISFLIYFSFSICIFILFIRFGFF